MDAHELRLQPDSRAPRPSRAARHRPAHRCPSVRVEGSLLGPSPASAQRLSLAFQAERTRNVLCEALLALPPREPFPRGAATVTLHLQPLCDCGPRLSAPSATSGGLPAVCAGALGRRRWLCPCRDCLHVMAIAPKGSETTSRGDLGHTDHSGSADWDSGGENSEGDGRQEGSRREQAPPPLLPAHRERSHRGACCSGALWCPREPRHRSPVSARSWHQATLTHKIKLCNLPEEELCDLCTCSGVCWEQPGASVAGRWPWASWRHAWCGRRRGRAAGPRPDRGADEAALLSPRGDVPWTLPRRPRAGAGCTLGRLDPATSLTRGRTVRSGPPGPCHVAHARAQGALWAALLRLGS